MLFCLTTVLCAHSGRTDKYGGHNGPGGYHYHGGGASKSNNSFNTDYLNKDKAFLLVNTTGNIWKARYNENVVWIHDVPTNAVKGEIIRGTFTNFGASGSKAYRYSK